MRWVRCGRRGAAGFTAALLLRRTLVVLEEIEDERLRCRVELAISARAGGGRVGGRIVVGRRGFLLDERASEGDNLVARGELLATERLVPAAERRG